MTETPSESTDLKTQYTAQVATDLERNAKEQERLIGEIDALQEQLLSLRQDHAVLVNMQQALGVAAPEPAAEEVTTPSVPRQKTAPAPEAGKRTRAKKAEPSQGGKGTRKATATKTAGPRTATTKTATAKTTGPKTESTKAESTKPTAAKATTATKTATAKSGTAKASDGKASTAEPAATKTAASKTPATKTAASKTAAKTATAEKAQPTLVELIRRHLTEQSEPRSAAEVATALTQAHPDRRIQTNVVRTTLEGLVAKSNAQRVKQGSSVYYTGPDAPGQAAPPQPASEPAPAAD
ncbi:hypothetical protein [Streptomyces caniscabiei]|uniref:hypothetical protein n=1 Tax=Streptomyces caniscabiei TaxID=2746961 RepID=UPI00299FE08B|nr:hypothetical protein [Streptomyces caniscabiei]MDX3726152.1 hypothetical protein [Streptomyces caniscabiei]